MMDAAVLAILEAHEAKRPGTRSRAVANGALELGYEIVPPKAGSTATYLRLIRQTDQGSVTLYLDDAKLTSQAQAQTDFAASLAGAVRGAREVRFPFESTDPVAILGAFAGAGPVPTPVVPSGSSAAAPVEPSPLPAQPYVGGPMPLRRPRRSRRRRTRCAVAPPRASPRPARPSRPGRWPRSSARWGSCC